MEGVQIDLYERVAKNIVFLRKSKSLSQEKFAIEFSNFLGFEYTRQCIAAYEKERNRLNVHTLFFYSKFFKTPIDDIVNKDLTIKET